MQRQLKSIPVKASGFGESKEIHLDVDLEKQFAMIGISFSAFLSPCIILRLLH